MQGLTVAAQPERAFIGTDAPTTDPRRRLAAPPPSPRHPRHPRAARPTTGLPAIRAQPQPPGAGPATSTTGSPTTGSSRRSAASRTGIGAGCRSRLALVIGLNVWAATAGATLSQGGWQIDGSDAARAEALVADRFGEQATSLIVDPHRSRRRRRLAGLPGDRRRAVAPLADEPIVSEILTYTDVGDPSFVSRDGTKTFALVRLDEEVEDAVDDAEHLAEPGRRARRRRDVVTGIPLVQHEFNEAIEQDLFRAEAISLPIAMLILLAVFGTLVGAVLPVIIAGMALPSAMAVISLLAGVTEMSIFVTNVATMIGLALSIDYSLFTVSRFREELRHRPVADAVEHTMATVGKAVAISGIAVAIGLSSLTVFESAALRSMGIGGVVTVLSTLVFGLTVLPGAARHARPSRQPPARPAAARRCA